MMNFLHEHNTALMVFLTIVAVQFAYRFRKKRL